MITLIEVERGWLICTNTSVALVGVYNWSTACTCAIGMSVRKTCNSVKLTAWHRSSLPTEVDVNNHDFTDLNCLEVHTDQGVHDVPWACFNVLFCGIIIQTLWVQVTDPHTYECKHVYWYLQAPQDMPQSYYLRSVCVCSAICLIANILCASAPLFAFLKWPLFVPCVCRWWMVRVSTIKIC